jgi:NADH-quinone oxidoreductase subunit N
MAVELAERLGDGSLSAASPVLILGGLMVAVGLAFKLSAVPFHFWCPDVFEGASAEVNAFLSVASKAAALALLVRVALGIGYVPGPSTAVAQADVPAVVVEMENEDGEPAAASDAVNPLPAVGPSELVRRLAPVRTYMFGLVVLLSAVTCTFGNLAAYGQTNIKRLLAYSTIAHAGYLMMPVAAAIAVVGHNVRAAEEAIGALCFYIAVYLFMNLGAFAVVAFLRNALRSEDIADYAGLIRRAPGVVVIFSLLLLSLLGLPPLAGFPAKVFIFSAVYDASLVAPEYSTELLALFVIGGLNTVVSLFYYLRVVKVMTLDPEPEHRLPVEVPMASLPGAFLAAVALPVAVFGVWFNDLRELTLAAASRFLS